MENDCPLTSPKVQLGLHLKVTLLFDLSSYLLTPEVKC